VPQAKVGIINVTGYAGAELARLLQYHPMVQLVSVTGRSAAGQRLCHFFPHLADTNLIIQSELERDDLDLVFSALPQKTSAEAVLPLLKAGKRVVDISADFRLKDFAEYPRWYDFTHPAPELLGESVYGLPELNRSAIATARLVANPGCYSTGAILALAPAVKEGIIEPDIIIDAKSGVSGAGRTLSLGTHYPEANENCSAYALDGHRHLPEIVQELKALASDFSPSISFVPHLVPMTRGILTSCYANVVRGKIAEGERGREDIRELYWNFYRDEPFVRVVDSPPQTKHVWGNNLCLIYPTADLRTGRLIVISCIDNLVKGAAGQAIQNMNLMLDFPEIAGLEHPSVYP
jgi:N-acetyl-gamma-glutamyl-phosphate reductase